MFFAERWIVKMENGKKKNVVPIVVGIVVLVMLLGVGMHFLGKGETVEGEKKDGKTTEDVQSSGTLNNPEIVSDSFMKESGQKVTWDCVWFGSYPQSEVTSDDSVYSELSSATEWDDKNEITLDETKYRRVTADDATYANFADKDDNNHYYEWSDSTTYHYFKYEPIKWRVLEAADGQAFLVSDIILDDQKYNTSDKAVTWETSSMRSWLNGYEASNNETQTDYTSKNFINCAFSTAEQEAILETTLENGGQMIQRIKSSSYQSQMCTATAQRRMALYRAAKTRPMKREAARVVYTQKRWV